MDSSVPELPPDKRHAIDADLISRAGDDATRYLLRWALNDGQVSKAMAFFPAAGRVDELTRAVNALFDTLGSNRNYTRYRTAILRLSELRREMYLTELD